MNQFGTHIADQALAKLNALRVIIVVMIAIGYGSTMPIGELNAAGTPNPEFFNHLGYDPSWIGIGLLFFLSGFLSLRSLTKHGSAVKYLESRFLRTAPLLFLITLIVILIIHPVFGNSTASAKDIAIYFLATITCIMPGEKLPGLLDSAAYACLIQGAIWTLKWGVIAHIAAVIGHKLGLFARRRHLLLLCIFTIFCYIVSVRIYTANPEETNIPIDVILAVRLCWPFLAGMTVYAYWDKLPKSIPANLGISAGFLALALGQFYSDFLPWTKGVIVSLTMAWAWLCVTVLRTESHQLRFLNGWPAMALAIYLINWPTAQILLFSFPGLSPVQLVLTSIPLTLVLAWGAHKLVSEKSYRYANQRKFQVLPAS